MSTPQRYTVEETANSGLKPFTTPLSLDWPPLHQEYSGPITEQLPRLLADDREPMNIAQVLEQRMEMRKKGVPLNRHDAWWNNYFDTSDLWLRHPDKGGKVVVNSASQQDLFGLFLSNTSIPKLVDDAFSLPDGLYEKMDGPELSPRDIEVLHGKAYHLGYCRELDIWRTLARDSKRLDRYLDAIKGETGRKDVMKLYFGPPSAVPTARFWYLSNQDNGSYAGSYASLTDRASRLIGRLPQAHFPHKEPGYIFTVA